VESPAVLVVNSASPYRTLADLLSAARAKPGELTMASVGPGTSFHIGFATFTRLAHVGMTYVPYAGSAPAVNAVLGEHVTSVFTGYAVVAEHLRAGKLRALAAATLKRIAPLPEVPTFDESGYPDFEITVWYGLCGPAKMPDAITARLATAVGRALSAPDVRQRYSDLGVEPRDWAGEKFDAFYKSEVSRWMKVARDAGLKPE
jgi:tripartite-type tricarboxylate transporter receptor subunit TctC